MTLLLKFRCVEKMLTFGAPGNADTGTVKLHAVTTGSEENKAFWRWTPSGQIEFRTINAAALDAFQPGVEYYCAIYSADAAPVTQVAIPVVPA